MFLCLWDCASSVRIWFTRIGREREILVVGREDIDNHFSIFGVAGNDSREPQESWHGMSQHMRPASWKDCRLPRVGTSSRTRNLKSKSISWALMQTCWGKVESGSVDGAAFPMIPDAFRMIQWIFNGARLKDNQRCPWVTLADSCHVSPTRWKTAFLSSFKQEKSRRPWPWQWRWAWRRSEGSFWRSYVLSCFIDLLVSVILRKHNSNQFASQWRQDKPFTVRFVFKKAERAKIQEGCDLRTWHWSARSSLIVWSAFTPLWQRPWRCSSVPHKGCAFDSEHERPKSRGEGKEHEREV